MKMGNLCDVCLKFDLGDPRVSLKKLFAIEGQLHELGVHFDTGAGCGYRFWEMDWSLSGPVKIVFKGDKEVIEARGAFAKQSVFRGKRAVFNAALCGVTDCSQCNQYTAIDVCIRREYQKELGKDLFGALVEYAEQKAHREDCLASSCSSCCKASCTHLAGLFQSSLQGFLGSRKHLEAEALEGSTQRDVKPHA